MSEAVSEDQDNNEFLDNLLSSSSSDDEDEDNEKPEPEPETPEVQQKRLHEFYEREFTRTETTRVQQKTTWAIIKYSNYQHQQRPSNLAPIDEESDYNCDNNNSRHQNNQANLNRIAEYFGEEFDDLNEESELVDELNRNFEVLKCTEPIITLPPTTTSTTSFDSYIIGHEPGDSNNKYDRNNFQHLQTNVNHLVQEDINDNSSNTNQKQEPFITTSHYHDVVYEDPEEEDLLSEDDSVQKQTKTTATTNTTNTTTTATDTNTKTSSKTSEKSEKKKKSSELTTKVIIRHLPKNMRQEEFLEAIGPLPEHNYFNFTSGTFMSRVWNKKSTGFCNINFIKQEDAFAFVSEYRLFIIRDEKGEEYFASTEFAINQRIPNYKRHPPSSNKDSSSSSPYYDLENDQTFIDFKNRYESTNSSGFGVLINADGNITADIMLKEIEERNTQKNTLQVTPLLEFVFSKQAKLDKDKNSGQASKKANEKSRITIKKGDSDVDTNVIDDPLFFPFENGNRNPLNFGIGLGRNRRGKTRLDKNKKTEREKRREAHWAALEESVRDFVNDPDFKPLPSTTNYSLIHNTNKDSDSRNNNRISNGGDGDNNNNCSNNDDKNTKTNLKRMELNKKWSDILLEQPKIKSPQNNNNNHDDKNYNSITSEEKDNAFPFILEKNYAVANSDTIFRSTSSSSSTTHETIDIDEHFPMLNSCLTQQQEPPQLQQLSQEQNYIQLESSVLNDNLSFKPPAPLNDICLKSDTQVNSRCSQFFQNSIDPTKINHELNYPLEETSNLHLELEGKKMLPKNDLDSNNSTCNFSHEIFNNISGDSNNNRIENFHCVQASVNHNYAQYHQAPQYQPLFHNVQRALEDSTQNFRSTNIYPNHHHHHCYYAPPIINNIEQTIWPNRIIPVSNIVHPQLSPAYFFVNNINNNGGGGGFPIPMNLVPMNVNPMDRFRQIGFMYTPEQFKPILNNDITVRNYPVQQVDQHYFSTNEQFRYLQPMKISSNDCTINTTENFTHLCTDQVLNNNNNNDSAFNMNMSNNNETFYNEQKPKVISETNLNDLISNNQCGACEKQQQLLLQSTDKNTTSNYQQNKVQIIESIPSCVGPQVSSKIWDSHDDYSSTTQEYNLSYSLSNQDQQQQYSNITASSSGMWDDHRKYLESRIANNQQKNKNDSDNEENNLQSFYNFNGQSFMSTNSHPDKCRDFEICREEDQSLFSIPSLQLPYTKSDCATIAAQVWNGTRNKLRLQEKQQQQHEIHYTTTEASCQQPQQQHETQNPTTSFQDTERERRRDRNRDRKDKRERDKTKGKSKDTTTDVKPKGEMKEFSKQSFDKKIRQRASDKFKKVDKTENKNVESVPVGDRSSNSGTQINKQEKVVDNKEPYDKSNTNNANNSRDGGTRGGNNGKSSRWEKKSTNKRSANPEKQEKSRPPKTDSNIATTSSATTSTSTGNSNNITENVSKSSSSLKKEESLKSKDAEPQVHDQSSGGTKKKIIKKIIKVKRVRSKTEKGVESSSGATVETNSTVEKDSTTKVIVSNVEGTVSKKKSNKDTETSIKRSSEDKGRKDSSKTSQIQGECSSGQGKRDNSPSSSKNKSEGSGAGGSSSQVANQRQNRESSGKKSRPDQEIYRPRVGMKSRKTGDGISTSSSVTKNSKTNKEGGGE